MASTRQRTHDQPLYLRIENEIRQKIATGEYPVNTRIPSEEELCEAYDVSRITVRRAIQDLSESGLLKKQRGLGTFVAVPKHLVEPGARSSGFSAYLVDTGHHTPRRILGKQALVATEELAKRLAIEQGDAVLNVRRLMFEDDAPMAIDSVYVARARFPHLLDELTGDVSFYGLLRSRYGVELDGSDLTLDVSTARAEEAHLLGCLTGAPLFIMRKVKYDTAGVPVHYSKTVIRGDRVTYRFQVGHDGAINARK